MDANQHYRIKQLEFRRATLIYRADKRDFSIVPMAIHGV
jgi:hypothetical protein